ncbi:hypothetical protein BH23PLA1_BH23PLA1_05240 [soil metagenome]
MAKSAHDIPRCPARVGAFRVLVFGSLAFSGMLIAPIPASADAPPEGTSYYSTASPPLDLAGPVPDSLGKALAMVAFEDESPRGPDPLPMPAASAIEDRETKTAGGPVAPIPPRLASAAPDPDVVPSNLLDRPVSDLSPGPKPETVAPSPESDPVGYAKYAMQLCRKRFEEVRDYTCTFMKRERINGRLSVPNVMTMKARTEPHSVYFKFQKPTAGREAIYVAGRHGGRALVHDVGLGKLIAGTLALDPLGSRAMDGCRHPITDAGIGHMIESIIEGWDAEMTSGETLVQINPRILVNQRPCTMIISTHPRREPDYLFHQVRVYIDREHGLPIRFEAYDWPSQPGGDPILVEEYTYNHLRLNVGLTEKDFDPSNKAYSFGRF